MEQCATVVVYQWWILKLFVKHCLGWRLWRQHGVRLIYGIIVCGLRCVTCTHCSRPIHERTNPTLQHILKCAPINKTPGRKLYAYYSNIVHTILYTTQLSDRKKILVYLHSTYKTMDRFSFYISFFFLKKIIFCVYLRYFFCNYVNNSTLLHDMLLLYIVMFVFYMLFK